MKLKESTKSNLVIVGLLFGAILSMSAFVLKGLNVNMSNNFILYMFEAGISIMLATFLVALFKIN